MGKIQLIIEKAVVTFAESALAYVIVLPSPTWSKGVIAGAIGAGLSAVYNLLRESTPTTTPSVTSPPSVPVA